MALPVDSGERRWRETLAAPVAIFAVTRLLFLLLASRATDFIGTPHIGANRSWLPHGDPLYALGSLARAWFRFDARWYADVAEHGYHWGTPARANTNFMPVYPVLARALQPLALGSIWLALWLVANLASLAALIVLARWAEERLGRGASVTVTLFVATFPFAFFFAAPYAEPLFLLLAAITFLAMERDRFPPAWSAAAISTITRPVGVALVLGLAAHYAMRREWRRAVLSLAALLPLAAFAAYLGITTGHPLGFTIYHTNGWVSPHGGIWTTFTSQFNTGLSPFDRIDAALALLFLVFGVAVWKRFGPGYGTFVLLGVLLPLSKGLAGMERYVAVLFPAVALWGSWPNRAGRLAVFAVSLTGLILFTAMFAAGYSIF